MRYKDNYMKYRVIVTDTDRVADLKSNYIDFVLYCDSVDEVYKLECRDYAAKHIVNKGQHTLGHIPIDFERDIVNIIVVRGEDAKGCSTHYNLLIMDITALQSKLIRNINMKDKVSEMCRKHHIEAVYKIMK